MKRLIIVSTIFGLAIFHLGAQTDSLKKRKNNEEYKYAICISNSLNFGLNDKLYPMNQMLGIGISFPVSDYKEKLYRNALHNGASNPMMEFHYLGQRGYVHSCGAGYTRHKTSDWSIYVSVGTFQTVYINYQCAFLFFKNKNWVIHPYLAIQEFISYNFLNETRFSEYDNYNDRDYFYINDKSLLFLTQIPVGVLLSKKHFVSALNITFNFTAIIFGKHKFEPPYSGFTSETINYSKFLFVNKVISENYLLSNIQLKFGYKF